MEKENMIPLNVRVPPSLKELMNRFIERDTHKDVSELTRDALREKIKRDAPELYSELFQQKGTSP
jgi:Arc/MetJ-type ribon-helix-helix transcriptional regulator